MGDSDGLAVSYVGSAPNLLIVICRRPWEVPDGGCQDCGSSATRNETRGRDVGRSPAKRADVAYLPPSLPRARARRRLWPQGRTRRCLWPPARRQLLGRQLDYAAVFGRELDAGFFGRELDYAAVFGREVVHAAVFGRELAPMVETLTCASAFWLTATPERQSAPVTNIMDRAFIGVLLNKCFSSISSDSLRSSV